MTKKLNTPQIIFKLSKLVERFSGYAQGKGGYFMGIRQEVKLAHQMLKSAPQLAIDIGGNVGEYTVELRKKNPSLEIHTFEPSSTNIEKLKARFSSDKNIKLIPCAVSSSTGLATLFSNEPGSGLGSLVKRKLDHFNIDFNFKEPIETLRFEEYWEDRLAKRTIDIVKIDIEGHELAALDGFGKALQSTKVIQFEFGGCNIDTRTYFQDFWYFFKDHGFEIYRMTPFGLEHIQQYRESDESFATTNFLAVNH
jgi:FkbM family methyltransferase